MGIMKEVKNQKRPNGNKPNSGGKKYPNMFTFHPTAEERITLKNQTMDLEKDLEFLQTFLARGCTLSLGMRLDSGSCYATIREKTENWMEAPSVSAWHGEATKAVMALAFVMRTKLEDFPEVTMEPSQFRDDW